MADHGEIQYSTADGNDYQEHEHTYHLFLQLAKWGVIKKNTAARYKARLTGRLKAVLAASAQ